MTEEQPLPQRGVAAEHVQRAQRRITIREAQAMAGRDRRPLLAWLLGRYLSKL